jgi:hypothetical protein
LNLERQQPLTKHKWWKDVHGTFWPPFLLELIFTDAHRDRLHERALVIGDPQVAACALELEHRGRKIETYIELKEAFARIEDPGYDLAPAQEMVVDVFCSPIVQSVQNTQTANSTSQTFSLVEKARAEADAALKKAMQQTSVPTDVEQCRKIVMQMLGIRRRRPAPDPDGLSGQGA